MRQFHVAFAFHLSICAQQRKALRSCVQARLLKKLPEFADPIPSAEQFVTGMPHKSSNPEHRGRFRGAADPSATDGFRHARNAGAQDAKDIDLTQGQIDDATYLALPAAQ